MLRLGSLKVTDFCQFQSKQVDFAPGTTCIVGRNGSGKSNLILAAEFALTGKLKDRVLEDVVRDGCPKTEVELKFSFGGQVGVVTRSVSTDCGVVSAAELRYGSAAPIVGSAKVTAAIADILQWDPRLIATHVFVKQGFIEQLLFQLQSDKITSFSLLLPEVRCLDPLVRLMQDRIDQLPNPDNRIVVEELKRLLTSYENNIDRARGEFAQLPNPPEPKEAKEVVARFAKNTASLVELPGAQERVARLEDAAAKSRQKADELRAELSKLPPVKDPDPRLSMFIQALRRLEFVEVELPRAKAKLDALVEPVAEVTRETLAELTATHNEVKTSFGVAAKRLAMLQTGKTVCNECGSKIEATPESIAATKATLTEAATRLSLLEPQLATVKKKVVEFETAHATWGAGRNYWQQELNVMQTTFSEATAVMDQLDGGRDSVRKLQQESEQQTNLKVRAEVLISTLRAETDKIAFLEKELITARGCLARLVDIAAQTPTEEEYRRNLEKVAEYEAVADTRRQKKTEGLSLQKQVTDLKATIEQKERDNQAATAITRYKTMLVEAREYLRALKPSVISTMVQQLTVKTNEFLRLLNSPFSVRFNNELEIMCQMPTGVARKDYLLSGGQKCILSLATRLAVNALFASRLGLLVLDEPTASLDNDNIAAISDAITTIKTSVDAASTQTIIITHAHALCAAADVVIDLGVEQ